MLSVLVNSPFPSLDGARSGSSRRAGLSVGLLVALYATWTPAQTAETPAPSNPASTPDKGGTQAEEEDYEVDASTTGEAASPAPVVAPMQPQEPASPPAPANPTVPAASPGSGPIVPPGDEGKHKAPVAGSDAPVAGDDGAKAKATVSPVPAPPSAPDKAESGGEPEKEGSNYRRQLRPGFSVKGFVQAQYQGSQLSQDQLDPDGAPLNQDEFGVRRARVRLDHGWDYAFATLEIDAGTLGGANVRLRRAEASVFYRGKAAPDETPWAVLTAGVTDLPFGGELGESQRDRLFMEQSIASRALFPTPADLGVKLWGAYNVLEYGFAVVNGEPVDANGFPTDRNAHKDIVGRVGFQSDIGTAVDLGAGSSFYVGKGFSPGTQGTKDSLAWVDTNNNGTVDDGEIQGITGSSPLPSENFDRWAVALDAHTRIRSSIGVTKLGGEVYLASNMDRGVVPSDPVTMGGDALALGGSLYAVQQVAKYLLIGLRGSYYDPNSNQTEERAGGFHLNDQSYFELSPTVGLSIKRARLSFEYDFVFDHLGRDQLGVPTDARNDRYTLRLQVDL